MIDESRFKLENCGHFSFHIQCIVHRIKLGICDYSECSINDSLECRLYNQH